jgi:NADPH2:quinone reductase
MHAIEIVEPGGPEVLTYVDKPRPSPGPREVLIKAAASGVNFVDTYFRSGLYPHDLPFVLGDRVASADAIGGYAEYCIAPADLVARVPDGVGFDVAAAALLKGMTAHFLIESVYRVRHGDTVLLHAGAGGVGLILTQWATSLGARVITTASTAHKAQLSRCSTILTTHSSSEPRSAMSRAVTESLRFTPESANPPSTPALPALRSGARSRCSARPADLSPRSTRSGSTPPDRCISRPSRIHFIRTCDEFAWRTGELLNLIGNGTIKVTVSGHYPLKDAAQAHRDLQSRKTVGSVVLTP